MEQDRATIEDVEQVQDVTEQPASSTSQIQTLIDVFLAVKYELKRQFILNNDYHYTNYFYFEYDSEMWEASIYKWCGE